MKPFATLGFSRLTAKKIGLPTALILHYIRKRLKGTLHQFDGRSWISHSSADWKAQFPFWSKNVLSHTLNSLEKQGLLTIRVLRMPRKRTFYTLNTRVLDNPLSAQKKRDLSYSPDKGVLSDTTHGQLQNFCHAGEK